MHMLRRHKSKAAKKKIVTSTNISSQPSKSSKNKSLSKDKLPSCDCEGLNY
ncbi:hypothetical protein PVAP13_1KG308810 [Panicum virgatum]|uniref:Uncharacterized protein n=1 Tax=Panicum virgatum TaxID=38727 RepID=A0A8T0XTS6_PANVG|nr:hypothetical protein PVAP13_1KG308810 [Panicum virgatum]